MHCRKASLLLWHRSLLYNIQKICYIFATYLYVMPIICLVIFWTTRYQKSCILLVGRMLIVAAYIYHIKWVLFYLSVIQISLCVKKMFFYFWCFHQRVYSFPTVSRDHAFVISFMGGFGLFCVNCCTSAYHNLKW